MDEVKSGTRQAILTASRTYRDTGLSSRGVSHVWRPSRPRRAQCMPSMTPLIMIYVDVHGSELRVGLADIIGVGR